MPAFLTSFKFADYSPNVFLNQAIEVYKNMPNNYGILEYFVNQKYQFKVEIDEHLDFTKEDIFYERLIIVNSKVFNIRTVGLKEFINEINSVQLQDIESSRNEARISELSYFILSKVLIHDEQEVLNLFDNWTKIISIDKFILENDLNDKLKMNTSSSTLIDIFVSENTNQICTELINDLIARINPNLLINLHIFINEAKDEYFNQNYEDSIEGRIKNIIDRFKALNYTLQIHNKNISSSCKLAYNSIVFEINSQNDTDFALSFIAQYDKVFSNVNEFKIELDISSFNLFISKLLMNFDSHNYSQNIKKIRKETKRDELMAEVYKTPFSGPQDHRFYRKSPKETLTLSKFLRLFIKPLSNISKSKIDLSFNNRGNIYILCITDGGHLDTLKAMRLIQSQIHMISKASLIFAKFQGQYKYDHIKSFSDYIINIEGQDNSFDFDKFDIF